MQISEDAYEALAHPELEALVGALDALDLPGLDCELASDILTLELAGGERYVINSHRAARQIWMAADRHAWHFDWDPEKGVWIAKKTGDELWSILSSVLTTKLGSSVKLQRS